jgi:hypothetical protein
VLAELTPAQSANAEPISQPFRFFQIDPAPAAPVVPSSSFVPETVIEPVAEIVPEIVAQTKIEPVIEQPAPTPKSVAGFPSITLDGPSVAEHVATASLDRSAMSNCSKGWPKLCIGIKAHRRAAPNPWRPNPLWPRHPMARVMRCARLWPRCATLNSCRKTPLNASIH